MKKFICSMLTVLMIFTLIPNLGFTATDDLYRPSFSIKSQDLPTIDPNRTKTIQFNLINSGNRAEDVVMTPIFGGDTPFISNTLTQTISIGSIQGKSNKDIKFDIKANSNAKPGNYPITLEFEYSYGSTSGGEYSIIKDTHKETIYVRVTGSTSQPQLIVSKVTTNPERVIPGQDVRLQILFENKGTMEAEGVKVRLKGLNSEEGFYIASGSDLAYLKKVPGSLISAVVFDIKAAKNVPSGTQELELEFEFEDNKESQMIYVNVENSDSKSEPKLIIDRYSFEPNLVRAGEEFEMNLSFFNTNSTRAVQNIKIFLTTDEIMDSNSASTGGSVFTPVNASNTFYIDNIPPKGRVEKKITMFTVPDAKAKTYTMTAKFEYEDSDAESFTATELIGVPVIQQSKLDIGELEYMSEAYIGGSTPISLDFYNTGKVPLYNMMIKLEGDFQTENAQFYVGNFESGNSEFYEGYVIPNEPGELKGNVVFTFEDSSGKEQVVKKEFNLNVIEMPPMDEDFMYEDTNKSSKKPFIWIFLIAAAVITGIVLKKRKKKKQEELSLDE